LQTIYLLLTVAVETFVATGGSYVRLEMVERRFWRPLRSPEILEKPRFIRGFLIPETARAESARRALRGK
jgi:hypothetical protein